MPARRIWHPSPGALVYRYDSIDEAELLAKARRRSRGRIMLAASVLAVSSAVPLAYILSNDLRVGAPIAATGIVSAPNGKPSIAVARGTGAGGGQSRPGGVTQRQQPNQQQQPAVVAQRPAPVRPASVTPPAAPPLEQQRIASTTPDAARATAAPPVSVEDKLRAAAPPNAVEQRIASVRPSTVTPPAASPPAQRRVEPATPDAAHVTANQPIRAEDKPRTDARPSPTVQQQPAAVAQAPASVRTSVATPPTAAQPEQHRVASATPDPTHATAPQPMSAEDQRLADAQRYLRAAHVSLKANNLWAAKSRVAAALAAQPDNRDAQRLRSTVHTLEQQRDALLSLARGCAHIERWACMSHNAGIALQIDSSSKEARRLATQAERQAGLQIESPAEPVTQPLPEFRNVSTHH